MIYGVSYLALSLGHRLKIKSVRKNLIPAQSPEKKITLVGMLKGD